MLSKLFNSYLKIEWSLLVLFQIQMAMNSFHLACPSFFNATVAV